MKEANLYDDKVFVRTCRNLMGMGQKQFAKFLGTSRVTVSRWENGHRKFPNNRRIVLIRILKESQREIQWFLSQEHERRNYVKPKLSRK